MMICDCPLDKRETVLLGNESTHYAKEVCGLCGTWKKFVPKPAELKQRRKKGSLRLANKNYCEMCLRGRDEIDRELVGHHVIESKDGGSNEASNIWTLCTGCHALVHHQRTYVGCNCPPGKRDEKESAA